MLARPVSDQVWKAPYDERPYGALQAGRQRGLAVADALCAEVDGGAGLLAPAVRVRVK